MACFGTTASDFERFGESEGIENTVIHGAVEDAAGRIWVGTSGGLSHIVQLERLMKTAPLELRITQATLGAKGLDPKRLGPLPWDPNTSLKLHLTDLEYGESRPTVLKVRLSGLSDEWFETRDHDLNYPRLGPGRYRFEALAIDSERHRTSDLVHLSFEILPPWWRTMWFQLLLVAAAGALLAGAWNWRMRKLKTHRRALERQLQ